MLRPTDASDVAVATGIAVGAGTYVLGVLAIVLLVVSAALNQTLASTVPDLWPVVGLAAALAVAVSTVLLALRSPAAGELVREERTALRLAAFPTAGALAVVVTATVWSSVALIGLFAAGAALVGLHVLRTAATTRHARRVTADAERIAPIPEVATRSGSHSSRFANLALALGFVAIGGLGALGGDPYSALFAVVGVGFLFVAAAGRRTLAVTDAGVLLEHWLTARCYEWEDFEAYHRGEHLVLLRRGWWRSNLLFDLEAVENDALEAIDRHLLEAEHRSLPVGGLRRAEDGAASEQ